MTSLTPVHGSRGESAVSTGVRHQGTIAEHESLLGSGPAVFPSPVVDRQANDTANGAANGAANDAIIDAIKGLVRDQQLRVAAEVGPSAKPDRGFHKGTIGAGQGQLRIGGIPEPLQPYLRVQSHDVVNVDVRFSYGSERPKKDDGKGMLGLSLRLHFSDKSVWNLTLASSPIFLKNADEVLLTLQAAQRAAQKYPSRSVVRRALAVIGHILRNAPRGRTWAMLKFGVNATIQKHASVASTTFYSPTTYALDHPSNGCSYAVRFELQPVTSLTKIGRSNGSLSQDLRDRFAHGPVAFVFGARFFTQERETPVDDPSVPWRTAFVKLGVLEVSPTSETEQGRISEQSYNPGQVAPGIRSLSTINEVRKAVYEASRQLRAEATM